MKTKVLVLGSSGMIGSGIYTVLSKDNNFEVLGTLRSKNSEHSFFKNKNLVFDLDVFDEDKWKRIIREYKPEVVVNCIGITKHIENDHNKNLCIGVNAIFPHKLANYCEKISSKLIHISSDCVFSGEKGFYTEEDIPDATDLYGIAKKLGEIYSSNHLTIRTSTIGHEIITQHGLLEWFLSQGKECKGYKNAIFSGVTTRELAFVIREIILNNKEIGGIYNLSSQPISKFDLLTLLKKHYSKAVRIEPDTSFIVDRSLNGNKLKEEINYRFNSWEVMIEKMARSNLEDKVV